MPFVSVCEVSTDPFFGKVGAPVVPIVMLSFVHLAGIKSRASTPLPVLQPIIGFQILQLCKAGSDSLGVECASRSLVSVLVHLPSLPMY